MAQDSHNTDVCGRAYRSGGCIGNVHSNLVRWMTDFGFKIENCPLKPVEFKETGRGLAAVKNISAGDLLIEVPKNLIITSKTVMNSYLKDSVKSSRLTPLAALCVFLVCERCRGLSSPWHPYLSTLPSTYTTPVSWSSDLIAKLPLALQQPVMDQRRTVLKLYKQSKMIFNNIGDVCGELKDVNISMRDFIWAWSTVNTRCVYWLQKSDPDLQPDGDDHFALVPFLDLLNHSHEAQVKAGYCEESQSYKIFTDVAYSDGQQVFINYGPHSNMKLLLEYGFILENNPNNVIYVTEDDYLAVLEGKQDANYLSIIRDNNFHKGQALSVDGPTWSLFTALKIAALQHLDDQDVYKARWHKCIEEDYFVSDFHRTTTHKMLLKLLKNKLEQFQFKAEHAQDPAEALISKLCTDYQQIILSCFPGS